MTHLTHYIKHNPSVTSNGYEVWEEGINTDRLICVFPEKRQAEMFLLTKSKEQ